MAMELQYEQHIIKLKTWLAYLHGIVEVNPKEDSLVDKRNIQQKYDKFKKLYESSKVRDDRTAMRRLKKSCLNIGGKQIAKCIKEKNRGSINLDE